MPLDRMTRCWHPNPADTIPAAPSCTAGLHLCTPHTPHTDSPCRSRNADLPAVGPALPRHRWRCPAGEASALECVGGTANGSDVATGCAMASTRAYLCAGVAHRRRTAPSGSSFRRIPSTPHDVRRRSEYLFFSAELETQPNGRPHTQHDDLTGLTASIGDRSPVMTERPLHLVTGVAAGFSSVSRLVADALLASGEAVRVMVHHDDGRADALRDRGAQVVVGDLTDPAAVTTALRGANRAFFNMAVSADYLEAAAVVTALATEHGELDVLVNMSQMTVSEMTSTSTEESNHQRWHWLAEQMMNWSPVPTVHVRPTVFLDNPLFTLLSRQSISERGELVLPFGDGRTSPVATTDVARVVATILKDPTGHIGNVYELTGPQVLDVNGLAEQYAAALGRPVTAVDMSLDDFRTAITSLGISEHITDHIVIVAKLHRTNRYDRLTADVETVTGQSAESVEHYITEHPDLFG